MPSPPLGPLVAWGRSLGLSGEPEHVALRPWSTTARVDGVWLKAGGDATRYEAALLVALRGWGCAGVVLPVADDVELGFLALPDGGTPLRHLGGGADRWPDLLAAHARLQRDLSERADDLLAAGVPDQRPAAVPELLDGVLARHACPAQVRAAVEEALPQLVDDCDRLATAPVPPTLQHDDLHDGNVLVAGAGAAWLIDWGDSSLGHPFGVLLVTLRALRHRHGLDERAIGRLVEAYLEPWSDLAPRAELLDLAERAQRVQAVGRALCWERALRDADDDERAEFGDPVTGWLEVVAGLE